MPNDVVGRPSGQPGQRGVVVVVGRRDPGPGVTTEGASGNLDEPGRGGGDSTSRAIRLVPRPGVRRGSRGVHDSASKIPRARGYAGEDGPRARPRGTAPDLRR